VPLGKRPLSSHKRYSDRQPPFSTISSQLKSPKSVATIRPQEADSWLCCSKPSRLHSGIH
jgi:hypothetical protein